MIDIAKQRRKTGAAIETRPAQPVDRTVAPDQRRARAVADQSIIFNAEIVFLAVHRAVTREFPPGSSHGRQFASIALAHSAATVRYRCSLCAPVTKGFGCPGLRAF